MAKILTGSTLSYGSTLPAPDKTSDGGMFYLTASYTDPAGSTTNPSSTPISRTPGLHVFSFQQDVDATTVGEQVGQGWKQVSSLAQYVLKTGDSMTGSLTVRSALAITDTSNPQRLLMGNQDSGGTGKPVLFEASNGTLTIGTGDTWNGGGNLTAGLYMNVGTGQLLWGNSKIWTAANMGSGSGLNADLLDGYDSSYFLNAANQTGTVSVARGGTNNTSTTQGGILYGSSATQISTSAAGSASQLLQSGGSGAPTWVTPTSLIVGAALGLKQGGNAGGQTMTFNWSGQSGTPTWVWGGSDGVNMYVYSPAQFSVAYATNAGSVGGYSASTSAVANTLALRDGNAYLYAAYLNQSSPNSEGGSISQIMFTNGSDNFLRKASISQLTSAMNLSGTYLPLSGGTLSGALNVNQIQLNYSSNTVSAPNLSSTTLSTTGAVSIQGTTAVAINPNVLINGALTVNSQILANGSNIIVSTGSLVAGQAGTTGLIKVTASGSGNSGYMEFYGSNQVRAGFIGNTGTTGSSDGGNITYVTGVHSFTGNINVSGSAILQSTLTLTGALVANSGTLSVTGAIVATGNITAFSDLRLKKKVELITDALDKVSKINGVTYTMADTGIRSTGVIAQEVQAVLPEAVQENSNGMLSVAYGNLAGVMIEAIKELKDQVESLKAELALLKAQ